MIRKLYWVPFYFFVLSQTWNTLLKAAILTPGLDQSAHFRTFSKTLSISELKPRPVEYLLDWFPAADLRLLLL